jgi:hypothetical protein
MLQWLGVTYLLTLILFFCVEQVFLLGALHQDRETWNNYSQKQLDLCAQQNHLQTCHQLRLKIIMIWGLFSFQYKDL